MSDRGFNPEEMITRTREEENHFGIVVDPITGQYVSYPVVQKSNDVGKIGDEFSKGTVPEKVSEPRDPGPQVGKQSKQIQETALQSEGGKTRQSGEGNIQQNWTLAGKNRENIPYKWVARGDTYPAKEYLKKAGMRWDPQHREWYSHQKPEIEIEGIYMMKTKA